MLYIHDTIEAFSGNLSELRDLFVNHIRSGLYAKRVRELANAAEAMFGSVNDNIRESTLMAKGRNLNGEVMIESCRAGLKEIFA
jgi:hypothetical protein